jgi:putative transposon-encoded protein
MDILIFKYILRVSKEVKVMTMPVKFEIKVVQVGNSLKITVPKEIAKHVGLKKGDTVQMWADNSHVVLEKRA